MPDPMPGKEERPMTPEESIEKYGFVHPETYEAPKKETAPEKPAGVGNVGIEHPGGELPMVDGEETSGVKAVSTEADFFEDLQRKARELRERNRERKADEVKPTEEPVVSIPEETKEKKSTMSADEVLANYRLNQALGEKERKKYIREVLASGPKEAKQAMAEILNNERIAKIEEKKIKTKGKKSETKKVEKPYDWDADLAKVLRIPNLEARKKALMDLQTRGATADDAMSEDTMKAVNNALGEAKPKTEEEIPREEKSLRKFLRDHVAKVIEKIQDPNRLTVEAIEKEVMGQLGFDRETFKPANLFPKDVISVAGKTIDTIRDEVEKEIEVRCTLRAAELLELKYMAMQSAGKAAKAYLYDMQGEETSPSKAALLNWEVLGWLKDIPEFGDGLTTVKVDKVLQILLLMGEKDKDGLINHGYLDELAAGTKDKEKLRRIRKARVEFDNKVTKLLEKSDEDEAKLREELDRETVSKKQAVLKEKLDKLLSDRLKIDVRHLNLHDPSNHDLRKVVLGVVEDFYGHDAGTIGLQIFRAFKEEGNYNWQHYLNSYFRFNESRKALAEIANVFTGSTRPYIMATLLSEVENKDGRLADTEVRIKREELPLAREIPNPKYGDQLKRVALSPLRIQKDMGGKTLHIENALNGQFLQRLEIGSDPKKIPEIIAFKGVKAGDGFKESIAGIGLLGGSGKDRIKGGRDGEAEKLITALKSSGEDLLGLGVVTQAELDRQIMTEAYNIGWELSIDNPNNSTDLGSQSDREFFFASPAQLAKVFVRMGGLIQELQVESPERRFIIPNEIEADVSDPDPEKHLPRIADPYGDLRKYYDDIIKETIKTMKNGRQIRGIRVKGTFPGEFVDAQISPVRAKVLPTVRGRSLTGVNDATDALKGGLPGVLGFLVNTSQGYH